VNNPSQPNFSLCPEG